MGERSRNFPPKIFWTNRSVHPQAQITRVLDEAEGWYGLLRFDTHSQVTPSSKVVGDLAQFMVQNELDEHSLVERAETLNFPQRYSLDPPAHLFNFWQPESLEPVSCLLSSLGNLGQRLCQSGQELRKKVNAYELCNDLCIYLHIDLCWQEVDQELACSARKSCKACSRKLNSITSSLHTLHCAVW